MAKRYSNHPEIMKQDRAWRSFVFAKRRREVSQVMTDYNSFLKSPEWSAYRIQVIKIYGGRCWYCGREKHLVVHHIRYNRRSLLIGGRLDPKCLRGTVVICTHCHDAIHKIQRETRLIIEKCTEQYAESLNRPICMSRRQVATKIYIQSSI